MRLTARQRLHPSQRWRLEHRHITPLVTLQHGRWMRCPIGRDDLHARRARDDMRSRDDECPASVARPDETGAEPIRRPHLDDAAQGTGHCRREILDTHRSRSTRRSGGRRRRCGWHRRERWYRRHRRDREHDPRIERRGHCRCAPARDRQAAERERQHACEDHCDEQEPVRPPHAPLLVAELREQLVALGEQLIEASR
ncbi:hypothetical protein HRbin27_01471 [bacterium HR27]|nr:hypothetical protein HRbin27_01471 [bacterium HR27]